MSLKEEAEKTAKILVFRHWRLWEWINSCFERIVLDRKTHSPLLLRHLWEQVFTGEAKANEYVVVKSKSNVQWFLQEWVPRAPGRLWIEHNLFSISTDDLQRAFSWADCPKELVDLWYMPGSHWELQVRPEALSDQRFLNGIFPLRMGCYRPLLNENSDFYALLGLITNREYFIDLGFPIAVSREVHNKLTKCGLGRNAVEIDCCFQLLEYDWSKYFSAYLETVGEPLNPFLRERINNVLGTKRLLGYIASPLGINVKMHTTHPHGTLRLEGHNGDSLTKRNGIIMICRYDVMNPCELPNQMTSAEFLLGSDHQFGTDLHPITDFDARLRRFASAAPLDINPASEPEIISRIETKVVA